MKILALGDVFSKYGVDIFVRRVGSLIKETGADFVVVNGENASKYGICPRDADDIFRAGADVITLGNHSFSDKRIFDYLEDNESIIRPANLEGYYSGRGYTVAEACGRRICVMNFMGQYQMNHPLSSPFQCADRILKTVDADIFIVDFHAEATSEKKALGYYLDGRANIVFGTHTHVQTADASVLPKGTGYLTDLGMTGPQLSVIGSVPQDSIDYFTGKGPYKFSAASEDCRIQGALFELDNKGKCIGVKLVDHK